MNAPTNAPPQAKIIFAFLILISVSLGYDKEVYGALYKQYRENRDILS